MVIASFRRSAEVQDVALRDAEMLNQLPGGVGQPIRDGPAKVSGKVFDGVIERSVRLAAGEQGE